MKKLLVLMAAFYWQHAMAQTVSIIPQPVSVSVSKGNFTITRSTAIIAPDQADRDAADFFNDYFNRLYHFRLAVKTSGVETNSIRITTKKFIRKPDRDAYALNVSSKGVRIDGDTYAGSFYGLQTLIQLLPAASPASSRPLVPCCTITDYPRFAYRGMHLDVCRHFFPPSFVKKYIDYLALHKLNYFHWHLTDDQGWRIEIKKYPRLTTVGGFRNGTIIGRYPGTGNDNQPYGGYYTQEEIKDIVQYAEARHITIVPEIEMPGHSSAAIAAYPWLSCFPGQKTVIPTYPSLASQKADGKLVQETWGVFDDVYCAGNDSTFLFLQDVMDEVMGLFPSSIIHVGGDECPKTNWKKCPRCQARMKELGLKDEHALQSYFIQRMEKYINGKGRRLLGWDEILEGGLAPNAMVMSWRGESGGIEAASQNHTVIMTPQKPVYFDHSQTKNEDSLVIGGYNPLEQVYAYEPIPKALDSSKAAYIFGAQANVWTEYMANEKKVEYMVFPRMSALAEILWSPKEKRNWEDFEKRLPAQFARYKIFGINASPAYYDFNTSILPAKNGEGVIWRVQIKQVCEYCRIEGFTKVISKSDSYTYDTAVVYRNKSSKIKNYVVTKKIVKAGQPVEVYHTHPNDLPLHITQTGPARVRLRADVSVSKPLEQAFYINKATGKKITIATAPNERYPGQGGAFSLVNGVYSNKGLSYPDWLGFVGDDLDVTIDLGKTTPFDSVRLHTLEQNGSWVYLPASVSVSLSDDGKTFHDAGSSNNFVGDTLTMGWITVSTPSQNARFIRILARNYGLIPDTQPGAGNKAWLFADEIQVY